MNPTGNTYVHQRDLSELPEPRFIYDTPLWLRVFVFALAGLGAVLGVGVIAQGAVAPAAGWPYLVAGTPVFAASAWLLAVLRPGDWRRWIVLAADRSGLYLVGRRRRVVFVPWRDVHDIAVETRITGTGAPSHARLRLTLPAETWPRLARLAAIEGDGTTRSYILPAVAMPGEEVAAALRVLRDGAAGP